MDRRWVLAWGRRLLAADDRDRLAAQFGMDPVKVDELAGRVVGAVVDAGRILDECQPRHVARCANCGAAR
jgi:hypothetical protein